MQLNSDGTLKSSLWLDQPDALQQIDAKFSEQKVTVEEAESLRHFVENGFLCLKPKFSPTLFQEFDRSVNDLWEKKPENLTFAYDGGPESFRDADAAKHRKPRYRIVDGHSHIPASEEIYLNTNIHRYINLIFGEPGVATQSLYFEYGSQQDLHRDPAFVATNPHANLLASWTALEDIQPDSGPLLYVPKSHRLPFHQFEPGKIVFNTPVHGDVGLKEMLNQHLTLIEKYGLEIKSLCPKQGEVFIWHGGLIHGGSPSRDFSMTRKSFVVHYSTRKDYHLRKGSLETIEDGKPVHHVLATRHLIEKNGCVGFANPVESYQSFDSRLARTAARYTWKARTALMNVMYR